MRASEAMGEPQMDDRLRALYREPPEGFIASRDALVKELKNADRPDEAARVKALRKPTVPAWAIDQLADRHPGSIQELLDAGAEVRAAQQAAMSSAKGAERLHEATTARRQVIGQLVRRAADILSGSGRAPANHLDEIRATLERASVDQELGERVLTGTLDRPAQSSGSLGDVLGLHALVDQDGAAEAGVSEPPVADTSVAERGRLRRDAEAATRKARRAREVADRLAGQVEALESRLQEQVEKHAAAESQALEAEMEARRASEAAAAAARS